MKTLMLSGKCESDIKKAADIICNGGIVAFPTETVYGLGALGLSESGISKIFEAKNRPATNPMILHVSNLENAKALWKKEEDNTPIEKRLAALNKAFWPGPLTIINFKSNLVPSLATAGSSKVAVRIPNHPIALQLLKLVKKPIVAPSANASNRPSPTCAAHVMRTLNGKIDAVLDGGFTHFGVESTVVDITNEISTILRPGAISALQLNKILPFASSTLNRLCSTDNASPGLMQKHYAPLIPRVRLGTVEDIARGWTSNYTAVILRKSSYDLITKQHGVPSSSKVIEALPNDPQSFAKTLYSSLYNMEIASPAELIIERINDHEWEAISDRISRACAE